MKKSNITYEWLVGRRDLRLQYLFRQIKDIFGNALAYQEVADFLCEVITIVLEQVVRAGTENIQRCVSLLYKME